MKLLSVWMYAVLTGVLLVGGRSAKADVVAPTYPTTPIPAVSSNTPAAVKSLADGLHIIDNGSLMGLRDVKNGQWAAGSTTAIYKKFYLSADGLIAYLPETPGANAFYAAGGRFWGGQLLYEHVPFIKNLADMSLLTNSLLQYGTVGIWGTRDFQYGIWRYGWDAGLTFKFGADGSVSGL